MNKAFILIIDCMFALILIISLFFVLENNYLSSNSKDTEQIIEIIISQKINDLLVTSQKLKIDKIEVLQENYIKLFPKNKAYIKINNQKTEINNNLNNISKTKLISNSIRYIKSSNKEIYIEIGVFY
jgi:hypothetical protein